MAIRSSYTDQDTGEVSANAHFVTDDPVMRAKTQQVTVRVRVYASKADYDAGRAPARDFVRTYGATAYAAVRAATLGVVEPALIATFLPGGVRVAD